jgi:hypothetical protein
MCAVQTKHATSLQDQSSTEKSETVVFLRENFVLKIALMRKQSVDLVKQAVY